MTLFLPTNKALMHNLADKSLQIFVLISLGSFLKAIQQPCRVWGFCMLMVRIPWMRLPVMVFLPQDLWRPR